MRRRSGDLNIFGMASLDLFASALGAFILISIIIFPQITNRSPVDEAEPVPVMVTPPPMPVVSCPVCPSLPLADPDPEPAACPICPALPAPPAPPTCPEITVPSPAPALECPVCPPPTACPGPAAVPGAGVFQFPHLDLVIALDVTSSMGRQVTALKAEVGQLSELLSRMAPSFAIGLVAYGDRYWEHPVISFPLSVMSGSPAGRTAFRGFVNRMSVRMGQGQGMNNDAPEAFFLAMAEAARMRWRSESERRVIVMVTDSPAYPEEVSQVVNGAAAIARAGTAANSFRVSTVYINSQGIADRDVEAFLQRVANAGRGQFVRDVGGSLTVNLLLSLL